MSTLARHSRMSLALAALVLAGCGRLAPTPAPVASAVESSYAVAAAPGEIIVRFRTGRQGAMPRLSQSLGLKAVKRVERLDAVVCSCANMREAIAKLSQDPDVAYAEPIMTYRANGTSDAAPRLGFRSLAADDRLGELWGMAKIEASAAWETTTGAQVKVAVVDTGVDHRHPDLVGRVDKGRDFINNDADAMDDQGHGTHVAGTIGAGLGNGGVVGVAPGVSMLAVKVLGGDGSGTNESVANGIVYAADQKVDVISMSLGGAGKSRVIEDAVKYAIGKGVLVVAAMGNENTESPSYPAAIPGVMAVGSTTNRDIRSPFSNYGKHISVAAPGSDILSTVPGGGYEVLSGTSMATPHVSGLAALVKAAFPALSATELRARIERNTDDLGADGFDKYFGIGRINARRAVSAL